MELRAFTLLVMPETRQTDAENINLLLENMVHLTNEQREAWFYCAIALVQHAKDPTPIIATGICKGFIHDIPGWWRWFWL
ncbi:dITP/XTP pyrophosphatase [Legionella sainthelensi]|nr:dITP/XTP pyrophosphatase [Legionella sainthelensi]